MKSFLATAIFFMISSVYAADVEFSTEQALASNCVPANIGLPPFGGFKCPQEGYWCVSRQTCVSATCNGIRTSSCCS